MIQSVLWLPGLDPVRLREGKDKCERCGRLMRSYAKTMDKRLVGLLKMVLDHLGVSTPKSKSFDMRDVFGDSHRLRADFSKLHCWGLVKHLDATARYRITERGWDFLEGRIQLPKRVWVFNDEVVEEDDVMVNVRDVDPRWQFQKSHYTMDFIPKKPIQQNETLFELQ